MKKFLYVILAITVSFIFGFSYRDVSKANGLDAAAIAMQIAFNDLKQTVSESMSGSKTELQPIETYWNAFNYIDSNYFGKRIDASGKRLNPKEMTYNAIRGMLRSLGDRYTRFLTPDDFAKMQEENRGDFEGIGAELDTQYGRVFIRRPMKGSPAIKAGLLAGDIILKVDDHIIHGMDIDDVVKLIRGKGGTKVKLTIKRKNVEQPKEFVIVRGTIPFTIVESKIVDEPNKIGYIMLRQFNEKSDQQFDEALGDLESNGMKGLILDLRDNPGGLLDVAVEIGSRFIEKGDIVIIKQGEHSSPLEVNQKQHNHRRYPLAVLINGYSASASEILAGAIQDHKAGTIIGTDSFGKGLVQTIINLEDGSAVSITTAKYLTPSGRDVNKDKIHPDIVVEPAPIQPKQDKITDPDDIIIVDDNKNDVQLKAAINFLAERLGGSKTKTVQNNGKI